MEHGPPGGECQSSTTCSWVETTPQGQVGWCLWKTKTWHDCIINLYIFKSNRIKKLKKQTEKFLFMNKNLLVFFCRVFPAVPSLWLHQPSGRSSFTGEHEVLPEVLLLPEWWGVQTSRFGRGAPSQRDVNQMLSKRRFQADTQRPHGVSAAAGKQQPGEDLDSRGEVHRNLDRSRRDLSNIMACKGQNQKKKENQQTHEEKENWVCFSTECIFIL